MKTIKSNIYQRAKILVSIAFLMFQFSNAVSQDKKAIIDLQFKEKNDQKFITGTAYDFENDSIGAPIEGIDLFFYVQRTFSLLPIGDRFSTTDENGEVTVEFPADLPGDTEGNIQLIVKIEDADDYADTSATKELRWGIPTILDDSESKRTLWAAGANAPISLMILTNSLIVIVWGIIFYIFFKIYQISKV